jgi:membrane protein implicated in regulation of membrane protease activity
MDWLGDHLWVGWLSVAILLGIAEMASLDLIFLMLAFGAVAGMAAAALEAPFALQALVAAGASVATLGLVRPTLLKRLHSGPELSLGHGKLVGTQGVVTERITGLQVGRVKLAGEIWSAAPYDESLTIEPGQTVEVLQIKGATAYVHPMPTLES